MITQVNMGCYTAFLTATKSNNELIATINDVDWITITGLGNSVNIDVNEFTILYELLTEVNNFISWKIP